MTLSSLAKQSVHPEHALTVVKSGNGTTSKTFTVTCRPMSETESQWRGEQEPTESLPSRILVLRSSQGGISAADIAALQRDILTMCSRYHGAGKT